MAHDPRIECRTLEGCFIKELVHIQRGSLQLCSVCFKVYLYPISTCLAAGSTVVRRTDSRGNSAQRVTARYSVLLLYSGLQPLYTDKNDTIKDSSGWFALQKYYC